MVCFIVRPWIVVCSCFYTVRPCDVHIFASAVLHCGILLNCHIVGFAFASVSLRNDRVDFPGRQNEWFTVGLISREIRTFSDFFYKRHQEPIVHSAASVSASVSFSMTSFILTQNVNFC